MMACWPRASPVLLLPSKQQKPKYVLGSERTPLLSDLNNLSEDINQVIIYTQMALQQRGKHSHALLFANALIQL